MRTSRLTIFAPNGAGSEHMEITVQRDASKQGATIGTLTVDGFSCFTLEDEVREPNEGRPTVWAKLVSWVLSWKIQNRTAIPRGRYSVIITPSPHFGCDLPILAGVPGFTAVRIHWGNKAADTDGCILVGQTTEANLIYKSKAAFDVLFPKIKAAINAGEEVFISIA